MVKRTRQFVKPEISFDVVSAEDGSGRGVIIPRITIFALKTIPIFY